MKKIILLLLLIIPISVNAKNIRYVESLQVITITVDENQIQATLDKKNINIKNINEYKDIFLNEDKAKYPIYINYNLGEYEFSNTKNGANSYIVSYLRNRIIPTGTSLVNSCESLFGYQLINLLKNNVFKIIYIMIPIILLIYTTMDFFKLVFADSKDGLQGAFQKLGKRIIAAVLIFLTPNILIFLIESIGSSEIRSCVDTFQTVENVQEK